MSVTVRVFVNGRGIDVPAGETALDAVRRADPSMAAEVAAGERIVTDSRGLPVANDAPLYGGAIFRIGSNRRRAGADEG